MRKSFFALTLICCLFYVISCQDKIPTNEMPMYGNTQFTDAQKSYNEQFIAEVTQKTGSREAASQEAIKLAWNYFYRKDRRTAMKRFNQAWLLDPNNAEAYYGFGFLLSIQGRINEAATFYKKALEINPNHSMALANLGWTFKDKAYSLYLRKRLQYPDEEVKEILKEALMLYEKAGHTPTVGSDLRMTDLDSDLSYIYYNWAIALEFNGEYAKAWEKIEICRKHGGDKIIEPGFIRELSRFMKEPLQPQ